MIRQLLQTRWDEESTRPSPEAESRSTEVEEGTMRGEEAPGGTVGL